MTMHTPDWNTWFGELRSAALGQPDGAGFERLMHLLLDASQAPDLVERLDAVALPYAAAAIAAWPDELRALYAPLAERLDAQPGPASWQLVRTLPIKSQDSDTLVAQRARALPGLSALDASWAMTGDGALDKLLKLSLFKHIDTLILRWNKLEGKHIKRLFGEGAPLRQLRRLDLSHNELRDESAPILAQAAPLTTLTRLGLARCRLSDKGVAKLLRKPVWSQLTTLDLSNNQLGAPGAAALVKAKLPLTSLSLIQCQLSDDAMTHLGALSALTELELAHNPASDAALAGLIDLLPALVRLTLPNTAAALNVCIALQRAEPLRELSLARCAIDAAALTALCAGAHQLTRLSLDSAPLDDAALLNAADSGAWQALERLDLTRTGLTHDGLLALLRHPGLPSLRALRAEFTPAAQEALAPTPPPSAKKRTRAQTHALTLEQARAEAAPHVALYLGKPAP